MTQDSKIQRDLLAAASKEVDKSVQSMQRVDRILREAKKAQALTQRANMR